MSISKKITTKSFRLWTTIGFENLAFQSAIRKSDSPRIPNSSYVFASFRASNCISCATTVSLFFSEVSISFFVCSNLVKNTFLSAAWVGVPQRKNWLGRFSFTFTSIFTLTLRSKHILDFFQQSLKSKIRLCERWCKWWTMVFNPWNSV